MKEKGEGTIMRVLREREETSVLGDDNRSCTKTNYKGNMSKKD